MSRPAQLLWLIPVCALWLLNGCAHYHLGAGGAPKFATLFIAPVKAQITIPQSQVLLTTRLREAFLHDGRVRLVDTAAEAEAVLQITVTGYNRSTTVSQPTDTGLARRIDVTLSALATLTDNRTQRALFAQRPLSVRRGVFADSGLVPSEYAALPLLADQLAEEAAHAVLDTW